MVAINLKLNRIFYIDCTEGGIVPWMHCAVCNQQWPQSWLPIFASAKQTEFPHETEWNGRLHRRYRVLHSLHPLTVTSAIRSRQVDNRFIPFYSVWSVRSWLIDIEFLLLWVLWLALTLYLRCSGSHCITSFMFVLWRHFILIKYNDNWYINVNCRCSLCFMCNS